MNRNTIIENNKRKKKKIESCCGPKFRMNCGCSQHMAGGADVKQCSRNQIGEHEYDLFYDKVNVSKILPALNARELPCLALALINSRVETIEALNLIEYVRKLNCMHLKVQFHLSFSSR